MKAPEATLDYMSLDGNTYTLLLYFDEPVIIKNDLRDNISISFNVKKVGASLNIENSTLKNYNAYEIEITIEKDVREGTIVFLTIKTEVTDIFENELQEYTIDATLDSKELIPITEALMTPTTVATATAMVAGGLAAGASAVGMGSASSATAFNPGAFWSFIEVLQIINYMLYLSADMPNLLRSFFRLLNIANADFMPNMFEEYIKETGNEAPLAFAQEGVGLNFIITCSPFLKIFATNLLFLVAYFALMKLFPTKCNFKKASIGLMYAAPLRIAVEGCLDLSLGLLLQLTNYSDDSTPTILGFTCVGIMVFGYSIVVYNMFFNVIFQPAEVLDDEDY